MNQTDLKLAQSTPILRVHKTVLCFGPKVISFDELGALPTKLHEWPVIKSWGSIGAGPPICFVICYRAKQVAKSPHLVGGLEHDFYFPIYWE